MSENEKTAETMAEAVSRMEGVVKAEMNRDYSLLSTDSWTVAYRRALHEAYADLLRHAEAIDKGGLGPREIEGHCANVVEATRTLDVLMSLSGSAVNQREIELRRHLENLSPGDGS